MKKPFPGCEPGGLAGPPCHSELSSGERGWVAVQTLSPRQPRACRAPDARGGGEATSSPVTPGLPSPGPRPLDSSPAIGFQDRGPQADPGGWQGPDPDLFSS